MSNTPSLYPEPAAVIDRSCDMRLVLPTRVEMSTLVGAPLEIEYVEGVGWSLEVRYDALGGGRLRQPFTGEQLNLRRIPLEVSRDGGRGEWVIHAGSEELSIDASTSSFRAASAGRVWWRSEGCPFFTHTEAVKILDELHSIEHTTFEEPTPWRPEPVHLETAMTRFRYPAPDGAIFGLPGQTGEFNRRGYRFELFNNDQPVHLPSRPPMYQSWPIVVHGAENGAGWTGVFHDNPARTFVDLGDFYKETVLFEAITNNTRVYLVHGAALSDITARFVTLLGAPVFPPAWAFGYQQCRYSYMSTEEIRGVTSRLRREEIPCDAIYFDIDYMDGYRVFTKNEATFGDLRACLEDISREGFHSVCIIDPGVKIDPGYRIYEELLAAESFVKDGEGKPFEIVCWPGKAALPDFFSPRVRSAWADLQRAWLGGHPFDGVWNDMNEPSNFDGGRARNAEAHSAEGPFRALFNLYGSSMAQASALGWERTHPGERGVIITRSGYPGVQKHAVIWHGDNHGWWEHLRLAVDTAIGYAMCGAFYTGPDVPGFFGNPSDDLAVRFFQLGAFLPLFRGHSFKLASSKEPYAFGGETTARIKAAIELRYSLLTEWYSSFERCVRTACPPLEPVFGDDGAPVRDTFLLFGKFLVCAVTNRDERARAVWLPEGTWHRLGDTAHPFTGGRWILESITLDALPVFVRGGSVIVRNAPGKNAAATWANPERFEIYRDAAGRARGYIFRDDGISVNDPLSRRIELVVEPGSAECVSREITG